MTRYAIMSPETDDPTEDIEVHSCETRQEAEQWIAKNGPWPYYWSCVAEEGDADPAPKYTGF